MQVAAVRGLLYHRSMHQGDILAGKYQLGRQIGSGGMSTVVEAMDLTLGRPVAIKFIRGGTGDATSRERLRREAVAVAQFQSEHIVRVFETGVDDIGSLFIAMERLRGFDVQSQIHQSGPIPLDEAVSYILQVCEALAHAHVADIIHRDIKPSNMFVVPGHNGRKTVKLLDFGIALNRGIRKNSSLTRDNLLGTPHFMSPEQIRDPKSVDTRTDIWALGVSLFQMLSAQLPFQSPKLPELIMSICEVDPPSLLALGIDVPQGVEACIRRCLRKSPNERFPSVRELAEALLPYAPKATGKLLVEGISSIIVGLGSTVDAPRADTVPGAPSPQSVDTIDEDEDDIDEHRDPYSEMPTLSMPEDPEEPSTEPTERGKSKIPPAVAARVDAAQRDADLPITRSAPPVPFPLSVDQEKTTLAGPFVSARPMPMHVSPKRGIGAPLVLGGALALLCIGALVTVFVLRDRTTTTESAGVATEPVPTTTHAAATAISTATSAPLSTTPPPAGTLRSDGLAEPAVATARPAAPASAATSAPPRPNATSPVVRPVVTAAAPVPKATTDTPVVPLPPELKGRQ